MTAVNPPGPPASTGTPAINPATGAQVVDANDLIVPSVPYLPRSPLPGNAEGYLSTPAQVLTALLVELRVQSRLFQMNSTMSLDVVALRADEYDAVNGGSVA